jgi:hypothetical protein
MESSKQVKLEVEDAEELDDFLTKAREAWENQHPDKRKHRGRKHEARIIDAIREVFQSGISVKTQGRLIKCTEEKFKHEETPPHRDTIRKYAKVFLILRNAFENGNKITAEQSLWLSEHMPASAFSNIFVAMHSISPKMQTISEDFDQVIATLKKAGIVLNDAQRSTLGRLAVSR